MKKAQYSQRKRNAKAQEIQARFDEYKAKNEVKVTAVNEARAEIERLRKVLEFYADERNYNRITLSVVTAKVLLDNGDLARKALEKG